MNTLNASLLRLLGLASPVAFYRPIAPAPAPIPVPAPVEIPGAQPTLPSAGIVVGAGIPAVWYRRHVRRARDAR